MKYVYIFLIFILGVVLGRWTAPDARTKQPDSENSIRAESNTNLIPEMSSVKTDASTNHIKGNSPSKELDLSSKPSEENQSALRTDSKARDKKIRELSSLLGNANEKNDIEEQNRLFAEMEMLDPKHEKVFEAKVMFLQDDENWDGAHEMLKDCVSTIPDSVYCHRRLANIRSSTNEDKLYYGTRCLQIAKNDPLCMVDVAIALHSKGDFVKARDLFEQALALPPGSEGYKKDFILFQYGLTLESLNMNQKAKEVFAESCRLKMKSACEKLKI